MRLCVAEMRSTYAFAVSANRKCSAYCMCRASSFSLAGARTASSEARRWLSDRPRHPFGPPLISLYRFQRWQGAAALSAAVTTTMPIGDAPTLHGHTSRKEESSLFPATLRERGSGGEALLLEKRPLPQRSPTPVFSGGSAREGTFLQEKVPSLAPHHAKYLNKDTNGDRSVIAAIFQKEAAGASER